VSGPLREGQFDDERGAPDVAVLEVDLAAVAVDRAVEEVQPQSRGIRAVRRLGSRTLGNVTRSATGSTAAFLLSADD
jgi:hypothetical protein